MGLRLLNQRMIPNNLVFGDSQLVIGQARENGHKASKQRHTLWLYISTLVKVFSSIRWYHILRDLNHQVNAQAKKGMKLQMGE